MSDWKEDKDILFVGEGNGFGAVEANAGIFKAFEEFGIVPGKARTSSGSSLFASLYYSGLDTSWFRELMETKPVSEFIQFRPYTTMKTLIGRSNLMFENENVRELAFTNINAIGARKVTTSVTQIDEDGYHSLMRPGMPGYVLGATSIPFVFKPTIINGKTFVDGGVMNNIPAPSIKEAKYWKHIFVFLAPKSEFKQDGFVNAILGLINAVFSREVSELTQSGFFELPNVTLIQPPSSMSGGLLSWSNNFEFREACYNQTKEILKNVKIG